MKDWRWNVMLAVLFVGMVTMTVRSEGPIVPCTDDGYNWATIAEPCAPNDPLLTCAQAKGPDGGDPNPICNPPSVYVKRHNENFYCYPSVAHGRQNTLCVRAKDSNGEDLQKPCLDKQPCQATRTYIWQDYWCVSAGVISTVSAKVYTNTPCAAGGPPKGP